VELPVAERAGFVDRACADEPELQRELEGLLANAPASDGWLRDAIGSEVQQLASDAARAQIGRRIGPFRLIRLLGRGGMGAVYLAERDDAQFSQRVAIKMLSCAIGSSEAIARLRDERQILAALDHPHIVRLLDGGSTDDGMPYLVMEYIEGTTVTAYAEQHQLSLRARIALIRRVCAALQYAHQNLVIHRDIKPSNILVTEERRVKLLDFGIAKLLNPTLGPADQAYTRTEWRVMTPEYASPEQVRGDSLTTASDVYALGVLLYELLSGRRPHRLTSRSPQELTEIIVQRDPVLPSIAVTRPEPASSDVAVTDATPETIAEDRHLTVERLRRRLEGTSMPS